MLSTIIVKRLVVVNHLLPCFCAVLSLAAAAVGQPFDQVINIPPEPNLGQREQIRSGTQLNLFEGGTIGIGFEVGNSPFPSSSAELNVLGGEVGNSLDVGEGGTVNISSGRIGSNFRTRAGSTVSIAGGTTGNIWAAVGTDLTITGGELRVDGELVSGLDTSGNSVLVDVPPETLLSGTLADGTPFAYQSLFNNSEGGRVTLTAATLPAIGPALITASTDPVPAGIRAGQTLVVDDGGMIDRFFNAGRGSKLRIEPGGSFGEGIQAVGSEVEILGGTVGAGFKPISLFTGSHLTVSGGEVGSVTAYRGSSMEIAGGDLSRVETTGADVKVTGGSLETLLALEGSQLDVSGGSVESFSTRSHVAATISGGTFGDGFRAAVGSDLTFIGNDFELDGVRITGLRDEADMVTIDVPHGATLSGTFADGTPFAFSSNDQTDARFTFPSHDSDLLADAVITLHAARLPSTGRDPLVASTDPLPLGIRGRQLVVDDGGVVPDNFNASRVNRVVVEDGGTVGRNFESYRSQVTIEGGMVGDSMDVFRGFLEVKGGVIGRALDALDDSLVILSAGTIGSEFDLRDSRLTMTGGEIAGGFRARGSEIQMFDGTTLSSSYYDSHVEIDGGTHASISLTGGTLAATGGNIQRMTLSDRRAASRGEITKAVISAGATVEEVSVLIGGILTIDGGATQQLINDSGEVEIFEGAIYSVLSERESVIGIHGGTINQRLTLEDESTASISDGRLAIILVSDQSKLHMSGGELIGSDPLRNPGRIRVEREGRATVSGGSIPLIIVEDQSQSAVLGGDIGSVHVSQEGKIDFEGGRLRDLFWVEHESVANVSGGDFQGNFRVDDSAELNLIGSQFILDGVDITASLDAREPLLILDRDVNLSGILKDGSAFSIELNDSQSRTGSLVSRDARLTVTLIPEPGSGALVGLLAMGCLVRGNWQGRASRP